MTNIKLETIKHCNINHYFKNDSKHGDVILCSVCGKILAKRENGEYTYL